MRFKNSGKTKIYIYFCEYTSIYRYTNISDLPICVTHIYRYIFLISLTHTTDLLTYSSLIISYCWVGSSLQSVSWMNFANFFPYFPFYFLVLTLLHYHCSWRWLLLHLMTLNVTHTRILGTTTLDQGSAPSQRHLPDNTQHSQQTDSHASRRNLARNYSKRMAGVLHFRPRLHRDLPTYGLCYKKKEKYFQFSDVMK
jgi:hypothetical protein